MLSHTFLREWNLITAIKFTFKTIFLDPNNEKSFSGAAVLFSLLTLICYTFLDDSNRINKLEKKVVVNLREYANYFKEKAICYAEDALSSGNLVNNLS